MTTVTIDESRLGTNVPARVGWGLSGLAILFLAADATGKLIVPDLMIANSPPLGIPADPAFYRLLGTILAICTALYAYPRTAVLGAILLTGYLETLEGRQPAAQLHPVRSLSRARGVGRTVPARAPASRASAAARLTPIHSPGETQCRE